jgi:3-oxoacyl-[acyl-carrier-protein] synthase III
MSAAEIGAAAGIPEEVIVERFGLDGKHVGGPDDHVSTMGARAGIQALERAGLLPGEVDVVAYFGSMAKDYLVWPAAPKIQHLIGADHAWSLDMANVSCGAPVALAVAAGMLAGDASIDTILLVGGCRESHLLDYENQRSRFMFNFGDGGAAALLWRDGPGHEILSYRIITDGRFADEVAVYAGGTRRPASHATVDERAHHLDVRDPGAMKAGLDPVSGPNFARVAREACEAAGVAVADIRLLAMLHTKRSFHDWIVGELGVPEDRAVYLRRHGHMSGLDPIVGIDLHQEELTEGDLVLCLAAGTGYTWAATLLRW